jgi:hypothetical protein
LTVPRRAATQASDFFALNDAGKALRTAAEELAVVCACPPALQRRSHGAPVCRAHVVLRFLTRRARRVRSADARG